MLEMMMGNKTNNSATVKWVGNAGIPIILTEAGNLYAIGAAERLAGIGSTTVVYDRWTLIDSGVEAAGTSGRGLLYRKVDGSWWATGYIAYGLLGDGNYTTKTNVSSSCAAIGSTEKIKKITGPGSSTYILTVSGKVYGCGRNSFKAMGNLATPVIGFTQINSVIGGQMALDITDRTGEAFYWQAENKTVYASGSASYGAFMNSSTAQFPTGQTLINNGDQVLSGMYAVYVLRGKSIYTGSSQYFGQLGDGVSGTGLSVFRTTIGEIVLPTVPLAVYVGLYGLYVKLDDGWWYTGNTTYNGIGNSLSPQSNVSVLTKVNFIGLSGNQQFIYGAFQTMNIALDDNRIMVTGDTVTAKIPGYSVVGQTTWVELPLTGVV